MDHLLRWVETKYSERKSAYPDFSPGDTVRVSVKIKEGNKERIQAFEGVVIKRSGTGGNGETFSVRKVSAGVGIERTFPILSPSIGKIEIVRYGSVRQARLYYFRGKYGKSAKIKEKSFAARKRKQEMEELRKAGK